MLLIAPNKTLPTSLQKKKKQIVSYLILTRSHDYDFAYFSKTEDFEKIHTRNAGRKRINHTCFITLVELKKKLKNSKADQVAKEVEMVSGIEIFVIS